MVSALTLTSFCCGYATDVLNFWFCCDLWLMYLHTNHSLCFTWWNTDGTVASLSRFTWVSWWSVSERCVTIVTSTNYGVTEPQFGDPEHQSNPSSPFLHAGCKCFSSLTSLALCSYSGDPCSNKDLGWRESWAEPAAWTNGNTNFYEVRDKRLLRRSRWLTTEPTKLTLTMAVSMAVVLVTFVVSLALSRELTQSADWKVSRLPADTEINHWWRNSPLVLRTMRTGKNADHIDSFKIFVLHTKDFHYAPLSWYQHLVNSHAIRAYF